MINFNFVFKVLLVDDSPHDRFVVKRALNKSPLNFSIYEASSFDEAADLFYSQTFDLALVDFYLNNDTGQHVLQEIGHIVSLHELPVIIMTGQFNESIAINSIKQGAFDCITKSSESMQTLWLAVYNAIHKSQTLKQVSSISYMLREHALLYLSRNICTFQEFHTRLNDIQNRSSSINHKNVYILLCLYNELNKYNIPEGMACSDVLVSVLPYIKSDDIVCSHNKNLLLLVTNIPDTDSVHTITTKIIDSVNISIKKLIGVPSFSVNYLMADSNSGFDANLIMKKILHSSPSAKRPLRGDLDSSE